MRVRSLSLLQLVSVRCSLGYPFGREIGAPGWPARVRAVVRFASAVPPHPYTDSEMAQTRTRTLGPAARPVAVPADLDNPSLPKASGRIELPLHIRWSGPPLTYDLNDRQRPRPSVRAGPARGNRRRRALLRRRRTAARALGRARAAARSPGGVDRLDRAPPPRRISAQPVARAGRGDHRRPEGSGRLRARRRRRADRSR